MIFLFYKNESLFKTLGLLPSILSRKKNTTNALTKFTASYESFSFCILTPFSLLSKKKKSKVLYPHKVIVLLSHCLCQSSSACLGGNTFDFPEVIWVTLTSGVCD